MASGVVDIDLHRPQDAEDADGSTLRYRSVAGCAYDDGGAASRRAPGVDGAHDFRDATGSTRWTYLNQDGLIHRAFLAASWSEPVKPNEAVVVRT